MTSNCETIFDRMDFFKDILYENVEVSSRTFCMREEWSIEI